MADVFISYSRRNSDFARRLIDRLTLANKNSWVDWEGIPLTAPNWWNEIKSGIEKADNFVFIMSPDSMASVVCNMELDYALELNKRIVPVMYRDIKSQEAFASIADFKPDAAMQERLAGKDPLIIARNNWQRLSHVNWFFFGESVDFEEAFGKLIKAVETDLDYVQAHTRYQDQALQWQRRNRRGDLLLFGDEVAQAEAWLHKGDGYAANAKTDDERNANPEPKPLHREYIGASRRAANIRRALQFSALAAVFVMVAAIVIAIGAGSQAAQSQQEAATAQANVVTAEGRVTIAQGEATQAGYSLATATSQLGQAQEAIATATSALGTAAYQQGQAEQQAATAQGEATQAGIVLQQAQATATQIPPTLTQAAVLREEAEREREVVGEFANVMLNQANNPAQLLSAMDALVARYPNEALAYQARGLARRELKDYAGAITDYDKALELDSTLDRAYTNRGLARYNSGDLLGAIADYSKSIELDPNYALAYNNRGIARYDSGDLAGAIADYDKALELDPNLANAYYNRGIAWRNSGDLAGALVDYDKAIELDPNYAEAYNNRGTARYDSGDIQGALVDYDKAIELDLNFVEAYYNRGVSRYDSGDLTGALADYDKAIELDPNDAKIYNTRGIVYAQTNHLDEAIADFTRAIELGDINGYLGRGLGYVLQNNPTSALADWDAYEVAGGVLPSEVVVVRDGLRNRPTPRPTQDRQATREARALEFSLTQTARALTPTLTPSATLTPTATSAP